MAGSIWALLPLLCLFSIFAPTLALLEEKIVAFSTDNGSLPIHDAVIIHDGGDPTGIHIAARALVQDFEEITGSRPRNITWAGDDSIGNGTSTNAIIIGTTDSDLIGTLVENDDIDVSEIEGKWETFKTTVVRGPLPGVDRALVIVGSDMRGTAFGVYTLAEQCGQSP